MTNSSALTNIAFTTTALRKMYRILDAQFNLHHGIDAIFVRVQKIDCARMITAIEPEIILQLNAVLIQVKTIAQCLSAVLIDVIGETTSGLGACIAQSDLMFAGQHAAELHIKSLPLRNAL